MQRKGVQTLLLKAKYNLTALALVFLRSIYFLIYWCLQLQIIEQLKFKYSSIIIYNTSIKRDKYQQL